MSKVTSIGDLLRPPETPQRDPASVRAALSRLPNSWRTVIAKAEEWPFVDPDVMLDSRTTSLNDYPEGDEVPSDIVPFSEYEPWGKMETETGRDYELFSEYRASGMSRTFTATGKHFSITQVYISKVARKHDWVDRVRAWDQYREQIYTTEVIESIRKMAHDHADIANRGIKALSMVFDELIERMENDPLHEEELAAIGFRSLFALAEKAARAVPNLMNAERLSRGLPTEISANITVKENRIVIQTTEELAEIVQGLGGVLDAIGEIDEGDDIIDVSAIEIKDADDVGDDV